MKGYGWWARDCSPNRGEGAAPTANPTIQLRNWRATLCRGRFFFIEPKADARSTSLQGALHERGDEVTGLPPPSRRGRRSYKTPTAPRQGQAISAPKGRVVLFGGPRSVVAGLTSSNQRRTRRSASLQGAIHERGDEVPGCPPNRGEGAAPTKPPTVPSPGAGHLCAEGQGGALWRATLCRGRFYLIEPKADATKRVPPGGSS